MLQTLGISCITIDGTERSLRPRQAAFLSYLCLSEGRSSRNALARLMWPDKDRGRALRSLSQLQYETSRVLPEVSLRSDNQALWVEGLDIDVLRVRRLAHAGAHAAAVALYSGPFLEHEFRSDALMEWRDEVNTFVSDVIVECIEHLLSAGVDDKLDDIVRISHSLLRSRPFDVSIAASLVAALVRCGRLRSAQEAHEKFTRDMGSGLLPSFDSYLANESRLSGEAPVAGGDRSSVPFVGRQDEVRELMATWAEVTRGQGRTVVIAGEPGIGKTRLAMQAMRRVAIGGGRAWVVHCREMTQRLPYFAAAELVNEMIRGRSHEVYSTDPEIQFLTSGQALKTGDSDDQASDERKHRLIQHLTSLVHKLTSEQALAILIDDAQWLDDFTALLLKYWSYRLTSCPVMIVLTVRTEDPEGSPEWIRSGLAGAKHLRLGQLGVTEAAELVAAFERQRGVTLQPAQRNIVLWQSAGQPYLLMEAMTSMLQGGAANTSLVTGVIVLPASAEVMLRRRFAGLSTEATWIAGIVALFGRPLNAATLTHISGLEDKDVAAALESLLERGIVVWDGAAVAYPHDLMRETASRQLAPTTRALLHGRIAAFMAHDGAPGLLAQHYAGAGDRENAGTWSLEAGSQALRNHLYSDCEFYFRLAMAHGAEDASQEAARQLARLFLQLGRTTEAEQLLPLLSARFSGDETDLLETIVRVDRELAAGSVPIQDLLAYAKAITEKAALLPSADLAPVAGTLFDLALDSSESTYGTELAEALTAAANESGNVDFRLQIGAMRAVWEALTSSIALGSERLSRLNPLLGSTSSAATRAIVFSAQGTIALLSGSLDSAQELFRRAGSFAESAGDIRRQMVIRLNEGVVFLERGDFDNARRNFDRVVAAPNVHYRVRAYANLSILHYEQQDSNLAVQAADAVCAVNSTYNSDIFQQLAFAINGLVAMRKGDASSVSRYGELLRSARQSQRMTLDEDAYVVAFVARLLLNDGQHDEALNRIDDALALLAARNVPARLRLSCEKAYVLTRVDPDRAYAIARDVATEADRCGAIVTRNRAEQTIRACRVQL